MSFTSIVYLLSEYWPYVLGGLGIGALTGWFSVGGRKEG
jgi:hypothetical protein